MSNLPGPVSVGIIMDGNRRWAKAKGLPGWEGHRAGKETLFGLLDDYVALRELYGTAHYTFYTFSTENWKRSPEEVTKLIALLEEAFEEMTERIAQAKENGVRIRFIGDVTRFPKSLQSKLDKLAEATKNETRGTIAFALSYGGRDELLRAVGKLAAKGSTLSALTEEQFAGALDTADMPDPELIIRTGGAKRLSNFMPWQSAYSELAFIDTLWPDFTRHELETELKRFGEATRNFGA